MEFKFDLRMPFCTFFKEIQENSPYIYVSKRCNKSVCEQIISDAYDKRFRKIKARETYVMSAKTGQSSLANRNIRFGKSDHPDFLDRAY
jgi:hypothetical protein